MRAVTLTLFGMCVAMSTWANADGCRERVRDVASAFGNALTDEASLRPWLPAKGKVRLHLVRMGAEDGYFSSSQVDALLQDFLDRGAVRSFEIARIEAERDDCIAVVTSRLAVTDSDGRPSRVELRLSIHPEGERWVVREIRESRR